MIILQNLFVHCATTSLQDFLRCCCRHSKSSTRICTQFPGSTRILQDFLHDFMVLELLSSTYLSVGSWYQYICYRISKQIAGSTRVLQDFLRRLPAQQEFYKILSVDFPAEQQFYKIVYVHFASRTRDFLRALDW